MHIGNSALPETVRFGGDFGLILGSRKTKNY